MPDTPIYTIPLPTDQGSRGVWGALLNNDTFRKFDQYLQQNPSQYITINASGTTDTGTLRLCNNINITNNIWEFTHSDSGTLDIANAAAARIALTITSGANLYRYDTVNNYSYGPGGLYIPLGTPEPIDDWISASTTTWTDVDVSDDLIPKGAVAVHACYISQASAGAAFIRVRKNGDAADSGYNRVFIFDAGLPNSTSTLIIPIDANGIFEAIFEASGTASVNQLAIWGYFL